MRVPLNDLSRIHDSLREDFRIAFDEVLETGEFVRGQQVAEFEQQFARIAGVKHCIACSNGTVALSTVYKALGLAPGDEVITTPQTWIATAGAAAFLGATVRFADTLESSHLLDPKFVERLVTARTKGIVAVHLFGQPAAMNELQAIADRYGLWLVEDGAQSHLATYDDQPLGTVGRAVTYSFFPGKNLGALGDAGAICTNDDLLAEVCREVVDHGGKGSHRRVGMNFRLNTIQAAVLLKKLPYLTKWTNERQAIAKQYGNGLAGIRELVLPHVHPDRTHVYHQYVISVESRDELRSHLESCGVASAVHYPQLVPDTPAFAEFRDVQPALPTARHNVQRCLSLPIFPGMRMDEVGFVIDSINSFFRRI